MVTEENKDQVTQGALYQSLGRSNAQIRQERGDAIAEDLEIVFKRQVEDLRTKVNRLKRERTNMYDFSPTNSQSLVMAKELDSAEIVEKDMQISLLIRENEIKLEIAEERYKYLIGKTI